MNESKWDLNGGHMMALPLFCTNQITIHSNNENDLWPLTLYVETFKIFCYAMNPPSINVFLIMRLKNYKHLSEFSLVQMSVTGAPLQSQA